MELKREGAEVRDRQTSSDVRFGSKADIDRACRDALCTKSRHQAHLYSITSSASCWSCAGTLRPKALAVFRLMTSSNLVACWTGNSAGWAPLRILSTYGAVWRARSARLAPYDISPPSCAPSLAA